MRTDKTAVSVGRNVETAAAAVGAADIVMLFADYFETAAVLVELVALSLAVLALVVCDSLRCGVLDCCRNDIDR